MWGRLKKLYVRTLRDKFRVMCRDNKVATTSNPEHSGIVEVLSNTDQLLDELMREQMVRDLQKKEFRKELDARKEALVAAEEVVREAASACATKWTTTAGDNVASSSRTPEKRRVHLDNMDERNGMIRTELQSCLGLEVRNISLLAEELQLHSEK